MKINTQISFSIFLVIFLFSHQAYCQDSIGCQILESPDNNHYYSGDCTPDQNGDWESFRNMNTYIPDVNSTLPLHNPPLSTIEVNINIIQKDNGTGNFPENQTTIDRMKVIMGFVNSFYANYSPSDPISWVTELPNYDSKVRFSLGETGSERIYFYRNTDAWDDTWPSTTIEPYLSQNYPERLEKLNIYIFGNPDTNNFAHASLPSWTNFNKNSWTVLFYWSNPGSDYAISGTLAHELGHNGDLLHTYLGGGASAICDQQNEDFLQDVFLVQLPSTSNCPHTCNWNADAFAVNGDGITNNLLGGNQSTSYLSPMQAGQIHRSLAITSLRKYVNCEKSQIPLVIESVQEWDFDIKLYRDLIISDDAQLTLSCNLVMHPDAKIIIEPGGKLIIDGGKIGIDIFEDNQWQGIEVWGNPSAHQIPTNQGWLVITNGGTIENAEVAVRVGSEDYTGKGGGIVHAYEGEFLNNSIGAYFDPYSYSSNNMSYFIECNFDYTNTINGEATFTHVKLNDVHFIDITECTFSNNSNLAYAGYGIYSTNAIFHVEGTSSTSGWDNGQFANLVYGIYATAANSTDLADIRHTTFTNNHHGIYLSGMTLPRVTSNEFYVNSSSANGGYGLYLDESTDYWVEDNVFEYSSTTSRLGTGIIVNESGEESNEIYLNEFYNLEFAINVQGKNRHRTISTQGLVIRCNDYNNTDNDETILFDSPRISSMDGIASDQGEDSYDIEEMAGNIFYYETTATDYDDLNNEANDFFYYYSTNAGLNNVNPLDFTSNTVQKKGNYTNSVWSLEAGCESGINTGGGGGTEGERSAMNEAQTGIESTEAILAALVDGGDTEALNTEVETSSPPETVQVYNELMAESPNLSETVVESTIEKETVIPNTMLRDVMVANPHTANSQVLLNMLDERFDPMPDYMKAQILAGRSLQSLKQELESQLASHKLRKAKAMNAIIRYYQEEIEDPQAASDSLLALLQNDNTPKSAYRLAWLYFEKGNYTSGQNVISNIPVLYVLDDASLQRHQNISDVYNMLCALYANGISPDSLSASQVSDLQTLANEGEVPARAYARNILLQAEEVEYDEPILLPDLFKSAQAIDEYNDVMKAEAPKQINVYPNPSTDYVILEYYLEEESEGSIEIKNVNGVLMHTVATQGKQDQLSIITKGWNPGIYIASLIIGGKTTESIKFTIVK